MNYKIKKMFRALNLVIELDKIHSRYHSEGGIWSEEMGKDCVAAFKAADITPFHAARALRFGARAMGLVLTGGIIGAEGLGLETTWFWSVAPEGWSKEMAY